MSDSTDEQASAVRCEAIIALYRAELERLNYIREVVWPCELLLNLLRDNLDETGATIWVRRGGRVD